MADTNIIKRPIGDILKHFAHRNDLRSLAYVSEHELKKYVWILDTNIFVDDEYYPKCEFIVKNGNFMVSQDVIDELISGDPIKKNAVWARAHHLAIFIQKNFPDRIFPKPRHQLVRELQQLAGLISKTYIQKVILDHFNEIYNTFKKNEFRQNEVLDNFIHGINRNLTTTLKRGFEARARGVIQPGKIAHIEDFFIQNMKATLRDIFHNIKNYMHAELGTCKRLIIKHFFRPLETDIQIAASYIEHHKPRHHLGSNDKDVVELVVLHEYRAV
ncbi:hypothetical protein AYK26_04355 [Euryarchaeota archaeon SM23-78]|nr:MAG: hypothetical protein AYK26_04355 [Euryarchaeota archaeon SM23-78]MBW3000730.1 hypothetical protein [Candidatus Woesearchaeota archaeon]